MKELLKKVRQLEIKARILVDSTFGGEYQSAFRGQGLEFDEVRPYHYGDDIRSIDWNVTAKTGQVFIKKFKEEREQSLFVCFDVSGSENFGPDEENKRLIGTELSAIMAFSALKNNDKIGLITFSDEIETVFLPKKGKSHVLAIIRGLLQKKTKSTKTNISKALDFVNKVVKKRSIIIVISDFIDVNYEKSLKQLLRKHEIILVRLFHPNELLQQSGGIIPIRDAESGLLRWINSSNALYKKKLKDNFEEINTKLVDICKKSSADYLSINTQENYIHDLETFFKRRNSRSGKSR